MYINITIVDAIIWKKLGKPVSRAFQIPGF